MEKQGLDLYFPSHRESDFWHKNLLLLYNKSTQQILKSAHNSGIFFFIF